jgi:hypothetical protein
MRPGLLTAAGHVSRGQPGSHHLVHEIRVQDRHHIIPRFRLPNGQPPTGDDAVRARLRLVDKTLAHPNRLPLVTGPTISLAR